MFCIICGHKIDDDSLFCTFCGAKQPERKATVSEIFVASGNEGKEAAEIIVEPVTVTETAEPILETEIVEPAGAAESVEAESVEPENVAMPVMTANEPADEKTEPKKKLPIKKIGIIAGIVVVAVAAIIGLFSINSEERKIYKEAKSIMESGSYYIAERKFNSIRDYRDSDALYTECYNMARYNDAKARMEKGDNENLGKAQELLLDISGYKDSVKLYEKCGKMIAYNDGMEAMSNGFYETAQDIFTNISSFRDSAEWAETCRLMQIYLEAKDYYDGDEFEQAKSLFKDLGDFEDSPDYLKLCDKGIKYQEAVELYEAESYEEAKLIFDEILDFKEAKKYSTWCDCVPKYEEGLELLNKGKYTEAKEILKVCADANYLDSKDLYNKADRYQYYEEDYQAALKLYNAGKYYSAKVAFDKLGDYKDSAKKAENCVRSKPSSGEIYHNSNYKSSSVDLKITAPSGTDTFLKIYCGSDLVSTVFIRAGKSATVYLPSGTYTIDADYGSTWYGTTESFGPNGSYCTLLNGSSTKFSLSTGSWTLQLLASTTGNVGSKSRSWGS